MKTKLLTALFVVNLISSVSLAKERDWTKVQEYIRNEISGVLNNEDQVSEIEAVENSGSDMTYFRRFLFRLRANFGFDVSWVASLKVVPEVEFVFQRPLPEGYTDKPK